MKRPDRTLEQRAADFWASVDRSAGPDACWPWTGAVSSNGYGALWWPEEDRRGSLLAHHVAFLLTRGWRPKKESGRLIRHLCHSKLCCNPKHLRDGSDLDNRADDRKAGRLLKGAAKPLAKLTDDAVREIRRSPETGRSLAKRFGVAETIISRVRTGKIWTHVR